MPHPSAADGVPEAELSSFTHCADDSGGHTDGGSGDLGLSTLSPNHVRWSRDRGRLQRNQARKLCHRSGKCPRRAPPRREVPAHRHSCPSLRQESNEGNPIYAVYKPAGYTQAEVCAGVHRENDDAYGKWLDMKTDPPNIIIAC